MSNNRNARILGPVLLIATLGLLGMAPGSAFGAAAFQINSMTSPPTASPGEITIGVITVFNSGNVGAVVNSVSVQSANFDINSSSLRGSPVTIGAGETKDVPYEARWSFFIFPGTTSLSVTVFGNELPSGPSLSKSSSAVVSLSRVSSKIDLSVSSVVAGKTSLNLVETLPVTSTVNYTAPTTTFQDVNTSMRYYLSTVNRKDGNEKTLLLSGGFSPSSLFVAAQGQASQTVDLDLATSSALNTGTYFVLAETDIFGSFQETNENNNVGSTAGTLSVVQSPIDLVVESISTSELTTHANSVLPVSYTVRYDSSGGTPPPVSFTVRFFLAGNASDPKTFTPIINRQVGDNSDRIFSLPSGDRSSKQLVFDVPAQLTGTQTLLAIVDPPDSFNPRGEIKESNETNNTKEQSGPPRVITANPVDLVMESVAPLSAATSAFSVLPVTYVVRYDAPPGTFPSAFSQRIQFTLSLNSVRQPADPVLSDDFVSVNPRERVGQTFLSNLPSAIATGNYKIIATIDPDRNFAERDVNRPNNTVVSAGTVNVEGPRVDLVISAVSPIPADLTVTAPYSFTYTATYNAPPGNFQSAGVKVEFAFSRTRSFDPPLEALQSFIPTEFMSPGVPLVRTIFAPTPLQSDPGNLFLVGRIDRDNAVQEKNEVNNLFSAPIRLFRPPDDHFDSTAQSRTPTDTLPPNRDVIGKIDFPRDVDVYNFRAEAGEMINIFCSTNVLGDTGFFPVDLALFDRNGRRQLVSGRSFFSGSSMAFSYVPILRAGSYFLSVRHSNNTNTGRYLLRMTPVRTDLLGTSLTARAPAMIAEPMPVTLSASFTSTPTGPSPLFANVDFYLTPTRGLDRASAIKLLANRQLTLTTSTPIVLNTSIDLESSSGPVKPGSYFLAADLDSGQVLQETDRANNVVFSPSAISITDTTVDVVLTDLQLLTTASTNPQGLIQTTYTAQVQGSANASTLFEVKTELLLSKDLQISDDDISLTGSSGRAIQQRVNQIAGLNQTFTIPDRATPGTYFLLARVNKALDVVESNTSNNTRAAGSVQVGPIAIDLSIAAGSALTSTLAIGQTVPVSVSVRYTAPTTTFALQNANVTTFLSRDITATQLLPLTLFGSSIFLNHIVPNQTSSAMEPLLVSPRLTPGTYFLVLKVESDFFAKEANTTNNTFVNPTPLTLGPTPIDYKVLDFSSGLTVTAAAGSVPVSFTIKIDGPGQSVGSPISVDEFPDVRVYLLPNGANFNPAELSSIFSQNSFVSQGENSTFRPQVRIPDNATAGLYRLYVVIDPLQNEQDADRSNSVRSALIAIGPPAVDIALVGLSLPAPATSLGDTLAVSTSIRYTAPTTNFANLSVRFRGYLGLGTTRQELTDFLLGDGFNDLFVTVAPGETKVAQRDFAVPRTISPGSYFLIGEIDPLKAINEVTRTNNFKTAAIPASIGASVFDLSFRSFMTSKSSFVSGETLPITATVEYQAPSVAYDTAFSVEVNARLSPDDQYDTSDLLLGSAFVTLKPGATSDVFLKGLLPAVVPPGSYGLIGAVDPNGFIPDDNRANNFRKAPGSVTLAAPAVDLRAIGVTPSLNSLPTSRTLTVAATFGYTVPDATRFDALPVDADFLLLPGSPAYDRHTALTFSISTAASGNAVKLTPNGTVTITKSFSIFSTPGTYYPAIALDRFEKIADITRTNNLFISQTPLTVTSAVSDLPPADLAVGAFTLTTSSVVAGGSLAVPFSVSFTGSSTAPTVFPFLKVFLNDSGTLTATQGNFIGSRFPTVTQGQVTTGTVTAFVPHATAPRSYFILQDLQPNGYSDSNPTNNRRNSSNSFAITANPVNRPPLIDIGGDRTVAAGRAISFFSRISDPENDPIVTRSWSDLNNSSVLAGVSTTEQNLRFTAPATGSVRLQLTAVDSLGATSSTVVLVTIKTAAQIGAIIDTYAGAVSLRNSSLESADAQAAFVNDAEDVAVDSTGGVYYLERFANRVRKIDPSTRKITTIAGTPGGAAASGKTDSAPRASFAAGFAGDGGSATASAVKFANPEGIGFDRFGNLLIADTFNQRIRQVSGGTLSTLIGGGAGDPFGEGGYAGDGGPPLSALLNEPHHVVQATDFAYYIADTGNRVVRKLKDGVMTTFAGTGFPGSTGDGQLATRATLNSPIRLALDGANGLLIVDSGAHRIRRVNLTTNIISTVAGSGVSGFNGDGAGPLASSLNFPRGVAVAATQSTTAAFISDTSNNRIRQIVGAAKPVMTTLAGTGARGLTGDAGPAAFAQLTAPNGMAIFNASDGSKSIYFGESGAAFPFIPVIRSITIPGVATSQTPAVVLRLTEQGVSRFEPLVNNLGGGTANTIKANLLITGLPSAQDGHLISVTLPPAATGDVTQTFQGTSFGGTVTISDVSLRLRSIYTVVIRDETDQKDLGTKTLTDLRPPVAVITFQGALIGAKRQLQLDSRLSTDVDRDANGGPEKLTPSWTVDQPGGDPLPSDKASAASFSFLADRPGEYLFTLKMTDPTGLFDVKSLKFVVQNGAPVARIAPVQRLLLPNAGSAVPTNQTTTIALLDGRLSSDPNGDSLTYLWTVKERPFQHAALNRTSFPKILTPTSNQTRVQFSTEKSTDAAAQFLDAGRYVFRLVCTDSSNLRGIADVELAVLDPKNIFPNANAGLDRGVTITKRSASPGDVAQDIPDVLGPKLVAFVRLDGRESADSPARPGDAPRKLTYKWTVASAPSSSSVTSTANPNIASPIFPSQSDTALASFIPDQPGVYTFQLIVNNGQYDSPPDFVSIDVSIRNVGAPPSAEIRVRDTVRVPNRISSFATPVLTFAVGDLVTLDGAFSTVRGTVGPLTYQWTQLAGDIASLSPSDTTSQPTFQPLSAGLYEYGLVVTDPKNARSRQTSARVLVVDSSNRLPVLSLSATANTTTQLGKDFGEEITDTSPEALTASLRVLIGAQGTATTTVTLTATVVDPDVSAGKQKLSYTFKQLSGPTVVLTTGAANVSALQSQVQFTPTTSRVHVFESRVQELDLTGTPTGVEVVRFIRVRVNSTKNGVPVARVRVLSGAKAVGLCQTIRLDGSQSADEGANSTPTVQYRWTQIAGPQVVLANPYTAQTTFVAPDLGSDDVRQIVFSLVVDDGNDQSEGSNLSISLDPTTTQDVSLDLIGGLDLISLPVSPKSTYTAADLAAFTGSPVVVRVAANASGGTEFNVWHAGLNTAPFLIQGNEGYLVSRRTSSVSGSAMTTPLSGKPWTGTGLNRQLTRGTNIISYPRGFPDNETAETLRARANAAFVARYNTTKRGFEVYMPGVTGTDFAIQRGRSYLLSAPASIVLTLPTCGN